MYGHYPHLTHQGDGVQSPEVPGAGLGSAGPVTIVRWRPSSKCRHQITARVTGRESGVEGVS